MSVSSMVSLMVRLKVPLILGLIVLRLLVFVRRYHCSLLPVVLALLVPVALGVIGLDLLGLFVQLLAFL